jgi:hypothetical protein
VGPQVGDVGSQSLDKDVRLSSWLTGIDVAGVRDDSWGHLHFALFYLVAKPSHVGTNVDGLAYLLHHPMVYG